MNFKIVLFLGFNSESTDRIYINKSYLAALIILTVGKDPKRKTLRLFALEIKISHLSPQEKVGGKAIHGSNVDDSSSRTYY